MKYLYTIVEQVVTMDQLLPVQISGWKARKTNPVGSMFFLCIQLHQITSATHLSAYFADTLE
jgi:hypothetical protein